MATLNDLTKAFFRKRLRPTKVEQFTEHRLGWSFTALCVLAHGLFWSGPVLFTYSLYLERARQHIIITVFCRESRTNDVAQIQTGRHLLSGASHRTVRRYMSLSRDNRRHLEFSIETFSSLGSICTRQQVFSSHSLRTMEMEERGWRCTSNVVSSTATVDVDGVVWEVPTESESDTTYKCGRGSIW